MSITLRLMVMMKLGMLKIMMVNPATVRVPWGGDGNIGDKGKGNDDVSGADNDNNCNDGNGNNEDNTTVPDLCTDGQREKDAEEFII